MSITAHFESRSRAAAMKSLVLFAIVAFASTIFAEDSKTTTYQTLPNSNIRDYRAPAYGTEGNTTYQTLPNSNIRDYRAPAYVTKGNTTYHTVPASNIRDYSAPAYVSGKGKK